MAQDAVLSALAGALNDLYRLSGSARFHAETVTSTGVSITRTGLRCLSLVHDSPRISGSQLASALDVSQPTVSRVLQQLESDGFVVRRPSAQDGRVSPYVASPTGRRALSVVHGYHVSQLTVALQGVSTVRRADLAAAVTELVGLLHPQSATAIASHPA